MVDREGVDAGIGSCTGNIQDFQASFKLVRAPFPAIRPFARLASVRLAQYPLVSDPNGQLLAVEVLQEGDHEFPG